MLSSCFNLSSALLKGEKGGEEDEIFFGLDFSKLDFGRTDQ